MTLVVVWREDDLVRAVADSRISSSANNAAVITDAGTKLFSLPVQVRSSDDKLSALTCRHSFGYAYAGSTLLATNAYTLALTILQNLFTEGNARHPSMASVADLLSATSKYVCIDYNSRVTHNHSLFESILFGYCPNEKQLEIYNLSPLVEASGFNIRVNRFVPITGTTIAIGSGAKQFFDLTQQRQSRGLDDNPMSIFQRTVAAKLQNDVGGFMQVAEAGESGCEFIPTLRQSKADPDLVSVSVLGFDVSDYDKVDRLDIGRRVFDDGASIVSGRAALRASGYDPDGEITPAMSNTAAFKAMLQEAGQTGAKCVVGDNYQLLPIEPVVGETYLCTRCNGCGVDMPLEQFLCDVNRRGIPKRVEV